MCLDAVKAENICSCLVSGHNSELELMIRNKTVMCVEICLELNKAALQKMLSLYIICRSRLNKNCYFGCLIVINR